MVLSSVLIGIIIFLLFGILILLFILLYYRYYYNIIITDCSKCTPNCTICPSDCNKCTTSIGQVFQVYSSQVKSGNTLLLLTQGNPQKPIQPDITFPYVYIYEFVNNTDSAQLWNFISQPNNGVHILNVGSGQYLTVGSLIGNTQDYQLNLSTTPTIFYLTSNISIAGCGGMIIYTSINNVIYYASISLIYYLNLNVIQYVTVILTTQSSDSSGFAIWYLITASGI